ncbi:hypothetical protein PBI_SCTP2_419 [Salicola phage SCTP-2]|nr:hypothetical protein PBI_SCTP2_419 [Salicola phage SCTP-2]
MSEQVKEEAHTKFETCEQKGHHLNKVECWVNGTHYSGTIQCGVCGTKLKYDYSFPVDPTYNLQKVYKVKTNGYWYNVHYDDLVFTFEQENEQDDEEIQQRIPTFFEKLKDKFKR